ncbi:MAG: hypothetical protein ACHREM_00105 [Polyangiales bacterium]
MIQIRKHTIFAARVIGTTDPVSEGARLADYLLRHDLEGSHEVAVKLDDLPPALLIACFFSSFLQKVWDENRRLLARARAVEWLASFDFQSENVARWMRDFEPVGPGRASTNGWSTITATVEGEPIPDLVAWVEERIESMLKTPGMWGSNEAIEMQVLTLLDVIAFQRGALDHPRKIFDAYCAFLRERFPEKGNHPLFQLVDDEDRFVAILGDFVKTQTTEAP